MKLYPICILLCFFLLSCEKKNKTKINVDQISMDVKVERFDKAFFEAKPNDLPKIKNEYPLFFPKGNDDGVWLEKMQNPLWRELYNEVQKKYSNFDEKKEKLEVLFKHIKYYFPKINPPKVITVIGEMDYNNKVIYTDSLLIVSLEMYLGKEHKFYEFPKYIEENFEENQILPDVVSGFFKYKTKPNLEKSLLSKMIFEGKELYLKDLFIPEYGDAAKIGYTPEQIIWCQENEVYMWEYFIEKELLYSDDQKLASRFINTAPFSKFYLEIDNESPGRVGAWIGWQIVRSYMQNHDEVSIQQLLTMNSKDIFENSKYKPKK